MFSVRVRPYRPSDEEATYKICMKATKHDPEKFRRYFVNLRRNKSTELKVLTLSIKFEAATFLEVQESK